jgi:DNA-binding FadR family transcriptional regulator
VARLAAGRRDDDEVREFKTLCARIDRELKEAGGPEARDPRYRRLNLEFHSAIHRMARAPLACAVAAGMWDRSDFFIKVAFGSLYFNRRVRQAHLAIRRAIMDGDPQAAEAAIATHLRQVGEAVATRLGSGASE